MMTQTSGGIPSITRMNQDDDPRQPIIECLGQVVVERVNLAGYTVQSVCNEADRESIASTE